MCLQYHNRKLSHSTVVREVLKYLPIWKPASSAEKYHMLPATNAFVLSAGKKTFPGLSSFKRGHYVMEDKVVQKVVVAFGGTALSGPEYLYNILQSLPDRPDPALYPELKELLTLLVNLPSKLSYPQVIEGS